MKALSIRQPWAWLILHFGKDIENRSWPTWYRGPFFIHAAQGMTRKEYDECLRFVMRKFGGLKASTMPPLKDLPRGGIVGRAAIVDCVLSSKSPWFTGEFMGHYGFVLRNPKPLPFRPCKGALGFFEVPDQT